MVVFYFHIYIMFVGMFKSMILMPGMQVETTEE